ncbi:MAG: DEAD/DEAH box helicase [Cellvibrionaceae bacterium]
MPHNGDYIKSITHYFRQSLIDGERLSPDIKALKQSIKKPNVNNVTKNQPFSLSNQIWDTGQVPEAFVDAMFSAVKAKPKTQVIPLVLMPRIDLIKVSNGEAIGQQSPLMTPLVVEVLVNRNGQLSPSRPPYVPREWLAPNQSDEVPFTDMAILDEFVTLNPFAAKDWQELKDYCTCLLCALVDDESDRVLDKEDNINKTLWECSIHSDYVLKPELSLALLEPPIRATFHIVNVLDAILRGMPTSRLYQRLVCQSDEAKVAYNDLTKSLPHSQKHFAQMTGEFPLSPKQRNALHYLNALKDSQILAVNGPPGTGKTTLLRSVVANLWVEAALAGENSDPPIIAAASSNNNAVTNILDSFARIDENQVEQALRGRWLPDLDTYGLYGCSKDKANEKNPFAYMTKQGDGLMALLERKDYLEQAETKFLAAFNTWHDKDVESIEAATRYLHKTIVNAAEAINDIIDTFDQLQKTTQGCEALYGSEFELERLIEHLSEQQTTLNEKKTTTDNQLDHFLSLWQQRPFWQQLFSFLPPVKNRWHLANEVLARKLQWKTNDYSDHGIRAAHSTFITTLEEELGTIKRDLNEAENALSQWQQCRQTFYACCDKALLPSMLSEMTLEKLLHLLDIGPRFRLFKLTTHYWEGRWLLEMSNPIGAEKSPDTALKRYHRYAKLTPCLVATFNMLPQFFYVSEKDGDGWKATPLVDAIDLLIIDEAGQALPHMASASFAVAKKALLVGDIDQIEPVWVLSAGIDRANLNRWGLLNNTPEKENHYDNHWVPSGLLASSGSLMKVAQRQVPQHQYADMAPGLYLTEHRRCYNKIIKYCNDLVYHGHLEALRGNPKTPQALPLMGFIHHESTSQTAGKSRTNQQEALVIVQWIKANESVLKAMGNLSKVIAIITPFAKQANTIKTVLKQQGYASIETGTVHRFQGAECPVILFSSVYGSNDGAGSKFYDRGSNMLNVAVSRAKNSFIVFGHKTIFGSGGKSTPSGLLMQHLKQIDQNHLIEEDAVIT